MVPRNSDGTTVPLFGGKLLKIEWFVPKTGPQSLGDCMDYQVQIIKL